MYPKPVQYVGLPIRRLLNLANKQGGNVQDDRIRQTAQRKLLAIA